jgi:hypothetical protein
VNTILQTIGIDITVNDQGRRAAQAAQTANTSDSIQIASDLLQLISSRENEIVNESAASPLQSAASQSHVRAANDPNARLEAISFDGEIPDYLCCPGTGLNELMVDPLTIPSGFTYERTFLIQLIDIAKKAHQQAKCPMTKEPINESVLNCKTNIAIKKAIENFVTIQEEKNKKRQSRAQVAAATASLKIFDKAVLAPQSAEQNDGMAIDHQP